MGVSEPKEVQDILSQTHRKQQELIEELRKTRDFLRDMNLEQARLIAALRKECEAAWRVKENGNVMTLEIADHEPIDAWEEAREERLKLEGGTK